MTDAHASVFAFTVDEALAGQRVDRVIVEATPISRARAVKLLHAARVSVNGAPIHKPSTKLALGDQLRVLDALDDDAPADATPQAEELPLQVLFEDDDLLVVDKACGVVVHPAEGHTRGTLVHALLHYYPPIAVVGDPTRPGIVHRLDRDTSGAMLVAKSRRAYDALREAFREQRVHRQYVAIAVRTRGEGLLDRGTIETLHGRDPHDRRKFTGSDGPRTAITHYETLERFRDGAALVRCRLQTGRTHQIRMHLSEQGMPILGDPLYGGRALSKTSLVKRMALHAEELGVELPWMPHRVFASPVPSDLAEAIEKLRRGASWRG